MKHEKAKIMWLQEKPLSFNGKSLTRKNSFEGIKKK